MMSTRLTKEIVGRVIDRMLEIWESSERWTKDVLARDIEGKEISHNHPNAMSWCAVGCAMKAMQDLSLTGLDADMQEFLHWYTREEFNHHYGQVTKFNDAPDTSFEDVRLFVKCLKDKDIPGLPERDANDCQCPDCDTFYSNAF